jgi:hypothetical protein
VTKFAYLQLVHPDGFFTAWIKHDRRRIITTDLSLLFRIWEDLAFCRSKLVVCGEEEIPEIFYPEGKSLPLELLTQQKYDELVAKYVNPFSWVEFQFPLRDVGIDQVQFKKMITDRAKELGVTLHHRVPVRI